MGLVKSKHRGAEEAIAWLAAQGRDMGGLGEQEALQKARDFYAKDPVKAAELPANFAAYVQTFYPGAKPDQVGFHRR